MNVGFIVPCYNEVECAEAFYQEFSDTFNTSCPYPWSLVMVDDGSTDATWDVLTSIAERDKRVTCIRFSRNFGKEAALYAGLEHCGSDIVGIIDADLQQRPSTALEMLTLLLDDEKLDCIAAYQEERREGKFISLCKKAFYRFFSASIGAEVIPGASDFRVFRRNVADALLSMGERQRFSKGLFPWVGFNTYAYPYVPDERAAGNSKWSFKSLLRYAWSGITAFSAIPLRAITLVGSIVSIVAFIYAIVLIVKTLFLGVDLPGYTSTLAVVLLLGGVQLVSLGVIGEYLARDYEQGKQRPIYIASKVLNGSSKKGDGNE